MLRGRGAILQVSFPSGLPTVSDVGKSLKDAGQTARGIPLVFDFGDLEVSRHWILHLLTDVVEIQDLIVKGWESSNDVTRQVLSNLGLADEASHRPMVTDSTTAILSHPLRSGQSFQHDGDVILVGNLHDGAEIQATGSVCILGTLKGLVHAGYGGDNEATVIAMSYMANHIRIGTTVSVTKDPADCPWWGRPVSIALRNGVFVAKELRIDTNNA
ncbi:septum formation inhibitor MinC, C-terminal domain protein [Jonquetella sp. BV3C21]|nr:septum formation inhibitor MinC, C-terminal domain protein [Jonquetella sp. BV3C21]